MRLSANDGTGLFDRDAGGVREPPAPLRFSCHAPVWLAGTLMAGREFLRAGALPIDSRASGSRYELLPVNPLSISCWFGETEIEVACPVPARYTAFAGYYFALD